MTRLQEAMERADAKGYLWPAGLVTLAILAPIVLGVIIGLFIL